MSRYYQVDVARNARVSTEITGYAASTLVFLHSLEPDQRYLDAAVAAARFLARTAWDGSAKAMPFELDPAEFTYFFDCGIVVRGLLAVWRASGTEEFLTCAAAIGQAMASDFLSSEGEFHPILRLPDKRPLERDAARWSRSPGCYQLKSAMAWYELAEATGEPEFRRLYQNGAEQALRDYGAFLPGHPDRHKVMDRLHAFLYFLEGLLPLAADARFATALCDGIHRTTALLRDIAPEFARSDVYAQLLRIRLHADVAGVVPLDRQAAKEEAEVLETFQRVNGCFYFGRKAESPLPHESPVSTAFALQALALWKGCARPHRHLLI